MGERVVSLQCPVLAAGEDVEGVAVDVHLAGRLARAERDGEGVAVALRGEGRFVVVDAQARAVAAVDQVRFDGLVALREAQRALGLAVQAPAAAACPGECGSRVSVRRPRASRASSAAAASATASRGTGGAAGNSASW